MTRRLFALAAALATTGPAVAQPPECPCPPADPARYYLLLFGSDAGPGRPARTHVWATYVRATPAADGTVAVEEVTVSWLPADGRINALRPFHREKGRNPGLHGTFAAVCRQGESVTLFGPFETDASRFRQAGGEAARLASGRVDYVAVDAGPRRPNASNCELAVLDADPGLAGGTFGPGRPGVPAARKMAAAMADAGAFARPAVTHDWLIPALGLDRYPVARSR